MTKSKSLRTPINISEKVNKDVEGKDVDINMYKSMIGSLFYLITSKPDISFSVGVMISTLAPRLLLYSVMISHFLEACRVSFPNDATTLKQGVKIDHSTI